MYMKSSITQRNRPVTV